MRGPGGRGRGLLNRPSYNPGVGGMNPRVPGMSPGPAQGMNPGFGPRPDFAMHHPRGPMQAGGGSVLMAYGFDPDTLSCEGIFNLLCPFGNVMKVRSRDSPRPT